MKKNSGFILIDAIAAVVVVSICLTFIAQALLTNFRAGMRFQEGIQFLMAMENRLGLLCFSNGAGDQLRSTPHALEAPYEQFTVSAQTQERGKNLKEVQLTLHGPQGRGQRHVDLTTFIYDFNQVKTRSIIP